MTDPATIKKTKNHYGIIAKSLHWSMAVIILFLFGVGLVMEDMPNTDPDKFMLIFWHKSFGILILMLVLARLCWRFISPAPALPQDMKPVEKLGAHAGHYGLYMLMFAVPLIGWMFSSYAGFPVSFFRLFELPDLVVPDKEMRKQFFELHGYAAWALILLAGGHALAALYHHFIRKDDVLRRMLPFAKPTKD